MPKFEEGDRVEVVDTPNGLYVGNEYEILHVGEDSNGDDWYIVEVDLPEMYAALSETGKTRAGFHEHNLDYADR